MSTKITTLYNTLITRMGAIFPQHARLPNPYKIDQNNSLFLKKGWGVAFAEGVNTNRNANCPPMSIERTFNITISRQFYAREMDAAAKATTEKDLFEDQYLLIKDLESDPTLQQTIARGRFVSDSGIQFVSLDVEKDDFLYLSSVFTLEYWEDLT